MLSIKIYPRIHITLIGMNENGYRKNGGAGFCVNNPVLEITVIKSTEFDIIDKRLEKMNSSELKKIAQTLGSIYDSKKLLYKIKGTITGIAETHTGFGTATSLRLAFIEALMIINQVNYNNEEIVRLSGRGGTSGIGINTYFEGGYVMDIGVPNDEHDTLFLPSSAVESRKMLPRKMLRTDMPFWKFGVLIPNVKPKTQKEEVEFFKSVCPVPTTAVHETLYEVVYGTTASIIEGNSKGFAQSINNIQKLYWKKSEINLYGREVENIRYKIMDSGSECVGMSSLGPGLYFLDDNNYTISEKMRNQGFNVLNVYPTNHGREINYV